MAKSIKKVVRAGRDLLDHILGNKERLIKKYALDKDNALRLRSCPEVQEVMLEVLIANGLIEKLAAREEAEEADCEC